jgi:RNase P subunit RPR2
MIGSLFDHEKKQYHGNRYSMTANRAARRETRVKMKQGVKREPCIKCRGSGWVPHPVSEARDSGIMDTCPACGGLGDKGD